MHFKFSVLLSRANEKKITNVQGVLNRYNKRKKNKSYKKSNLFATVGQLTRIVAHLL